MSSGSCGLCCLCSPRRFPVGGSTSPGLLRSFSLPSSESRESLPAAGMWSQSSFHGFVPNPQNAPFTPRKRGHINGIKGVSSLIDEIPPNALRRKREPNWRGGFSLGVDLGLSRTGLALSKGYTVRPLSVLKLRGDKLELHLIEVAQKQEVDEFIIGLPKSSDGKETPQSNKVRSVAGRFAARAAQRGWRVYLLDEHGTTREASDRMLNLGLSESARRDNSDAYAAVMVLERYFWMGGEGIELVLPKSQALQEQLRRGPPKDVDLFFDDD